MENSKIIFISNFCSNKVFNDILEKSTLKYGNSIQKFMSLLAKGFKEQGVSVEAYSCIEVGSKTHNKKIFYYKNDIDSGIIFFYSNTINLPLLKNIIDFTYIFFKILFSPKHSKQYIICDMLKLSATLAAILASKLRGIKIIGLLTDMPGINIYKRTLRRNISAYILMKILSKYDAYIFLTKQMNGKVNLNNKPYIIIEGMVDSNMCNIENKIENKSKEKIIFYAGGLFEQYGIKMLINAFMEIENTDYRLYLFGEGNMTDEIKELSKIDDRIFFGGSVPNSEIVNIQLKSSLLINPRFTAGEYNQYSFPSKNMEYLASGTPVACTLLPGMPDEYLPFIYILKDESISGYKKSLEYILSKDKSELHNFGELSKQFVMNNKTNLIQSKLVYNFIQKI
jgi:glycosyltransferase involved in cell wall biosynthesis